MKLLKPGWVTHDGYPIFSLDIHPDGSRFATGGQGAGDSGRVVIWNMGPIFDEQQETKENIPKFLSRMDNHLNCVNCVRWSSDGKYLASAGDDKVIMIWQIARYNNCSGNSLFGGPSNAETWRCVATLRGHSGDILDLNWSKTENLLASCSVDNTVIIWNTAKWNEIVTTLRGHTGLVKGVSFDPIGKYVASQSDDKSLKVWRTADWKEEHTVTHPFAECGGTTHVLRLNWSPDGQHLVSAQAMNNCGSVAQIIERDGWTAQRDYVGHRKAVTCVRFNQNLLKKTSRKGEKEREITYSCLAVGSRDRSVSVWLTFSSRPLVVLHELFEDSVMDLSWSSCGRRLLACSWDGSVACFEFEERELGSQLTENETILYLERLYGKSMKSSNATKNVLAEDVEFMKVREENMVHKSVPQTNGHTTPLVDIDNRSMNDSRSSTSSRLLKGPTDKQIEVKMQNGKRRITPLYIPPPTDLEGIPIPFNSQATTFSTSEETKSKIRVEKIDSNLSPAKDNANSQQPDSSSQHVLPQTSSATKSDEPAAKSISTPSSQPEKTKGDVNKKSTTPVQKKKSLATTRPTGAPVGPVVQKAANVVTADSPAFNKRTEERMSFSLKALTIEKLLSVPIGGGSLKNQEIEVENRVNNSKLNVLRLKLLEPEQKVWEVIVVSKITAVTASETQTVISCEDNSVSVFSTSTGRRLHPPIILSSPTALLANRHNCLLVITTEVRMYLWDMAERKSLVRDESLRPLFLEANTSRSDLHIVSANINENRTPIISMSNRKSYAFDLTLQCWSLISDSCDLISICSDVKQPHGARREPDSFPLAAVQQIQRVSRNLSSVFQSNSCLQSSATITFVDQQLASSFILGSSAEYKHWLLALAQTLTDAGREDRLKELCTFLLGPLFGDPNSWNSKILGLDKRQLLHQVLVIMTSNLKLQRLFSEFKEQLNVIEAGGVEPMITESLSESTSPTEVNPSLSQSST